MTDDNDTDDELRARCKALVSAQTEGAARRHPTESIDDAIDRWHDGGAPTGASLHEFLGMTWEEYALWVETGKEPEEKP